MRRPGLRLVVPTDRDEIDNNIEDIHCSLCLFRDFNEIPCYHSPSDKALPPPPTAHKIPRKPLPIPPGRRFSPSGHSRYFLPSPIDESPPPSPTEDIEPLFVRPLGLLKRKPSPTRVTLRELRVRHSGESLSSNDSNFLERYDSPELLIDEERERLLRSVKSDEALQLVYESQIMAYLMSPLSDMGGFGE